MAQLAYTAQVGQAPLRYMEEELTAYLEDFEGAAKGAAQQRLVVGQRGSELSLEGEERESTAVQLPRVHRAQASNSANRGRKKKAGAGSQQLARPRSLCCGSLSAPPLGSTREGLQ